MAWGLRRHLAAYPCHHQAQLAVAFGADQMYAAARRRNPKWGFRLNVGAPVFGTRPPPANEHWQVLGECSTQSGCRHLNRNSELALTLGGPTGN